MVFRLLFSLMTRETKIVSVDQNKIPIKSQISISTYSHHRLYSEKIAVELSLFLQCNCSSVGIVII